MPELLSCRKCSQPIACMRECVQVNGEYLHESCLAPVTDNKQTVYAPIGSLTRLQNEITWAMEK